MLSKRYIDKNLVTKTGEDEYTAEASTLGLKPGEWPTHVEFDGYELHRSHLEIKEGETLYAIYEAQHERCSLTIFND